jgi:hypothetical protein
MDTRIRMFTVALILGLVATDDADGDTVRRCAGPDGHPIFTDRGCPPTTASVHGGEVLDLDVGNVVDGGALTEADRAQLERIDARRAAQGPAVFGIGASRESPECLRARARLDAHRARARRPHATSLLARGRELRAALRAACH